MKASASAVVAYLMDRAGLAIYLNAPGWIGMTASLGTMSLISSVGSAGCKRRMRAKRT